MVWTCVHMNCDQIKSLDVILTTLRLLSDRPVSLVQLICYALRVILVIGRTQKNLSLLIGPSDALRLLLTFQKLQSISCLETMTFTGRLWNLSHLIFGLPIDMLRFFRKD